MTPTPHEQHITPAPPRSPSWEWLLCTVLLGATLLNYADRQTWPITAVRVESELGLSDTQFGWIAGCFGLAFGIGGLIGGIIADRVNVRWLYPLLMIIWSCAGIITGWSSTFFALLLSRVALGLFQAGHWSCALRTTQRIFSPSNRPLANSILQAGAPLGAILPSVLMLTVVSDEPGSWRQIYWICGVLGIPWALAWLATIRTADLQREVIQTVGTDGQKESLLQEVPFSQILRSRRYWVLVGLIICINTCWHYLRVWLPQVLQEDLHYTEKEVQLFFIPYWLSTFAGSLVSGWLARFLHKRGTPIHRARVTVFLGGCLLTALTLPAAFLPPGPLFFTLMFLVGFGALGLFPIYYSLNQELSAKHQGKVGGSLSFATWSVLLPVHTTVGWIRDNHPTIMPYIFPVIGLLPLIGLVLMARFWGDRPSTTRDPA